MFNSSLPGQNGRHFGRRHFRLYFLTFLLTRFIDAYMRHWGWEVGVLNGSWVHMRGNCEVLLSVLTTMPQNVKELFPLILCWGHPRRSPKYRKSAITTTSSPGKCLQNWQNHLRYRQWELQLIIYRNTMILSFCPTIGYRTPNICKQHNHLQTSHIQ